MTEVNKTLYIPLYGKSYVSKRGIILNDKSAEDIWAKRGFKLKAKSRSKWLAYYMGMRARIFDDWLCGKMRDNGDAVIIHIGCGLDSRVERVGTSNHIWYDVDFPEVIAERKHYFEENEYYKMLEADVRHEDWLRNIPRAKSAVVVMEGVSMYLSESELATLIFSLNNHFGSVSLLADCYTVFAAKASKIKNPVNDVGVTEVYGIDDPRLLERGGFTFIKEHDMTPDYLIKELSGGERAIFKTVYGGRVSKKLYRLYEFVK